MSNRYAPLPNPRTDREAEHEMEAAFEDSDDEDNHAPESQPLNPTPTSPTRPSSRVPGTYDFENVDYDYPPPGSPPLPSTIALPNAYGNSNGLIPSFNVDIPRSPPRRTWLQRSVGAILPSRYAERLGIRSTRPQGVVGGGLGNDGVFANVTAKPSAPVRIREGDETYVVPEDARAEAPPSYASAQADAVPPYWETTVHAPFSSDVVGEMIVDALPTGSLFSFLWNMLVSISFQFVGFLLTYLLHTTHAARLGSRAGLGVTLIQYGFALRSKMDNFNENGDNWGDWNQNLARPTAPATSSDPLPSQHISADNTTVGLTEEQANMLVADATTEWLSFFLMTVGWFVLLTSLLGFWRVKRWERGIIASQQRDNPTTPQTSDTDRPTSQFDRLFGLNGVSRVDMFRQGFGFGSRTSDHDARIEAGELSPSEIEELTLNISPDDPNRARLVREALANERRLQHDLRAAGLL